MAVEEELAKEGRLEAFGSQVTARGWDGGVCVVRVGGGRVAGLQMSARQAVARRAVAAAANPETVCNAVGLPAVLAPTPSPTHPALPHTSECLHNRLSVAKVLDLGSRGNSQLSRFARSPPSACHALPACCARAAQALANTLWAFATLRWYPVSIMEPLTRALATRVPIMKEQEVANTLWAYAK